MESDCQCRSLYLFRSSQSASAVTVRIEVFRITYARYRHLCQIDERYEVTVLWCRLLVYVPRHCNIRTWKKNLDLYHRRAQTPILKALHPNSYRVEWYSAIRSNPTWRTRQVRICLLYTSDAADERSSVDLGG